MTDLAVSRGDCEFCLQARFEAPIRQLIGELQQALYERDSKVVSYAHHDLLAQENAMFL